MTKDDELRRRAEYIHDLQDALRDCMTYTDRDNPNKPTAARKYPKWEAVLNGGRWIDDCL